MNFFLGGGIQIFADVLVDDSMGVGAGTDGESSSNEEEEMGLSSINGRNWLMKQNRVDQSIKFE